MTREESQQVRAALTTAEKLQRELEPLAQLFAEHFSDPAQSFGPLAETIVRLRYLGDQAANS
jgi:hypothetical protein